MTLLSKPVYERAEKDGWRVLMPLTGKRQADANVLNPMAGKMLDMLRHGWAPSTVLERLETEFPSVPRERIWNDIRGLVMRLAEMELYDMTDNELEGLCRSTVSRLPGLHVMDETEIRQVARTLQEQAEDRNGDCLWYGGDSWTPERCQPHTIRALHFSTAEVLFVHNDEHGRMNGCVAIRGFGIIQPVQNISLLWVSGEGDAALKTGQQIIDALGRAAAAYVPSTKLRMAFKEYDDAAGSGAGRPAMLQRLLDTAGFRREAVLKDELGPRINVVFYSKPIENPPVMAAAVHTAPTGN